MVSAPAFAQTWTAAGHAELAWPDACQVLTDAGQDAPVGVRRYRMLLNDQPAGEEIFRFWHRGDEIRVEVTTRLDGTVWLFAADFRHCRIEHWRQREDGPELLALRATTRYAVPFKPDQEIWIERDPGRGETIYRGHSRLGSFEEHHPLDTGAITPWSIRTVDYDLVLNVFEHGVHRSRSRLVESGTLDGMEVRHYAFADEWPRHLWYRDGMMIRFCGIEAFGIIIETIYEPYAGRELRGAGLDRPCAELFE